MTDKKKIFLLLVFFLNAYHDSYFKLVFKFDHVKVATMK